MKILLVVHSFVPDAFAGVEIHSYNLARLLGERNEVYVLHRVEDPDRPEYSVERGEYGGVSTIRLVNNHTARDPWELERVPGVTEAFLKVLDELEPDVVHVHHLGHLSTDLVSHVKARGIPVVCTLHDYWHLCARIQLYAPDKGACPGPVIFRCADCFNVEDGLVHSMSRFAFLGDRFARYWIKLCRHIEWSLPIRLFERRFERSDELLASYDYIIANSRHMMKRTIEFGAPANKIHVMRYGLKTRELQACRHSPSPEVRFGFMGSMVEYKGVRVLIDAFRRVPEAQLDIWGSTDHNKEVRDFCSSLDIPSNVRLRGGFSYDQITRVLPQIDVLIVPSTWEEAYGLTVDEAKLAGIPIIASRFGGIPEHLKHGKEGFLFKPGSVDELVRYIRYFVNSPKKVERMRPSGDDVLSLEENAFEVEQVYHLVLRRKRR